LSRDLQSFEFRPKKGYPEISRAFFSHFC
jgi:hypothetical protein